MKSILPVGLIAIATAGLIQLYLKYFGAMKAAPTLAQEATEPAAKAAEEALLATAETLEAAPIPAAPNYALWFLIGCLFVIILVVIFELIKAKRSK